MNQKIVYVDVDDTLVRSAGNRASPDDNRHSRGQTFEGRRELLCICGVPAAQDYARKSAVELEIADCFAGYLPKPNVIIDDQPVEQWRGTRHIYPLQTESA